MVTLRKVIQTVLSIEQSEGVGARVRRSIGRPELKNLDPFLLLDEFKGGKPAGFPDHPHRGFETFPLLKLHATMVDCFDVTTLTGMLNFILLWSFITKRFSYVLLRDLDVSESLKDHG